MPLTLVLKFVLEANFVSKAIEKWMGIKDYINCFLGASTDVKKMEKKT